jgi:hypothetical protein
MNYFVYYCYYAEGPPSKYGTTTILGNKAEIESIKRQGQVWAIL